MATDFTTHAKRTDLKISEFKSQFHCTVFKNNLILINCYYRVISARLTIICENKIKIYLTFQFNGFKIEVAYIRIVWF